MIASEVVDIIAQRVRDPDNTAHPRALIRDIFNRVQTALNASQAYVLETVPLALTPGKAIYRLETYTPELVTITDIEFENRFLDRVPWRNLWKISPTWLTDIEEPRAWSMIGRTLFAIYPVPAYAVTLNLKGPKVTTTLVDGTIPLDLRDEDADIAIDLTTAIFLLRQRDIENSQIVASRAADKLGLQEDAVMEEMRIEKL